MCGTRWLLAAAVALGAGEARAFAIFDYAFVGGGFGGEVEVEASLQETRRWSATPAFSGNTGLHDGIQVYVEPDWFGPVPPEFEARLQDTVRGAFAAWETPQLRFDIRFDDFRASDGPSGGEIDLLGVESDHPFFFDNLFYGVMNSISFFSDQRTLTNGRVSPGEAFSFADVLIPVDRLGEFFGAAPLDTFLQIVENILVHEIGHAIGLHHPNERPSFDSDLDPRTPVAVDPADPFAGLAVSPNVDPLAVMIGGGRSIDELLVGGLQPDDLSGLAVLYPVPEPATALLLGLGFLGLAARNGW